jgi:hypothetical protein
MHLFIQGYGALVLLFAVLNVFFPNYVLHRLKVDPNSETAIITETLCAVGMGAILFAVGWKWNHPNRIAGEGIETRRWFPFTWSGHMFFWIKVEYCGLLMIVIRSVRGYLKLYS